MFNYIKRYEYYYYKIIKSILIKLKLNKVIFKNILINLKLNKIFKVYSLKRNDILLYIKMIDFF